MWLFDLFFPNSENLICQDTYIARYFRESLEFRDDESLLYFDFATGLVPVIYFFVYTPVHILIVPVQIFNIA